MAVIIYPPTINWNWMVQRPQQIMKQFAMDGHVIYYCNKTQLNNKLLTKINPNINIVHNNKKFINTIIPKIRKYNKIIFWFTCPKSYQLINKYSPDLIIFDYIDDFPVWSKYIDFAVAKADLVFTSSTILKKQLDDNHSNKNSYLIRNGCDINHFQKYKNSPPSKPLELQNHKGTIISYIGAWASWIDQELIINIANNIPEAKIIIIGNEFGRKFSINKENIYYLGYKPYKLLPQYLFYCNFCIIPFKINRITTATNPIKMYEYLAAGKPVVSTNLPEVQGIPNVHIGRNNKEYIDIIKNLLSSPSPIDNSILNEWIILQTWNKRYQEIKYIITNNFNYF